MVFYLTSDCENVYFITLVFLTNEDSDDEFQTLKTDIFH